MERFIWNKGRKREYRGRLKDFNSLTTREQDMFKVIKREVLEELGDDTKVYVYGSHYWGYSDNNSDFDVRVDKLDEKVIPMSKKLTKKLNTDIHVMYVSEKRLDEEGVIIPD